jgi:EpsI family protein
LADVLPLTVDNWSAETSDGLVQPKTEGELAATLYSEIVGRIYHNASTGAAIMMLAAYGETQSDLLQLHRPEACYPAVGFRLVSSKPATVTMAGGGTVPVRRVVAVAPGRQENIVYWTRLGDYLPDGSGAQREIRLKTAMEGYIPDGVLIRFSMTGDQSDEAFAIMDEFIPLLMQGVDPAQRKALIGTSLAKQMQA